MSRALTHVLIVVTDLFFKISKGHNSENEDDRVMHFVKQSQVGNIWSNSRDIG